MRRFTRPTNRDVHTGFPSDLEVSQYEQQDDRQPQRKRTQHEQDQVDDEARRRAMKDLVQSWMDRLQLISLITTFLASVEAGILQVTNGGDTDTIADQVSNATLLSALVLHLHASFISFIAAFFLIRFKVKEAKREEAKVEAESGNPNGLSTGVGHPSSKGSILIDMAAKHVTQSPTTASPREPTNQSNTTWPNQEHQEEKAHTPGRSEPSPQAKIWSANPRLVQVGPSNRIPPIVLLSRCHSLCILFATVGFVLALIGIVVYSWAQQSKAVGAVTSGFLGLCLLSSLTIIHTSREHTGEGDVFTYD